MNTTEILQQLAQCTGTEGYHSHWSRLVFTDGVLTLAEVCQAYWLIDAIGSHQPRCRRDSMLREMQFWTLRKVGDGWELICERDTNDIAIRQKIEYSDFPLDNIRLWVQQNVILLPSEY